MAFRIEIRDPQKRKTLTFGPRTPGQVGKDILAVKIALGIIKRIDSESSTESEGGFILSSEELPTPAEVPQNKQQWFNCQTGQGTDIETASTFDLQTENVIKKFQIDNSFLILNYFFEKRGIRNILAATESSREISNEEYSQVVHGQIDAIIPLFQVEFGQLGEATLAVMHGWRPHTRIHNTGFVHSQVEHPNQDVPVVDIIPKEVFDAFFSPMGELSDTTPTLNKVKQMLVSEGYVHTFSGAEEYGPRRTTDDNGVPLPASVKVDNKDKLRRFLQSSRSSNNWVKTNPETLEVPVQYYSFDYIPVWNNTSRLTDPALLVLNNTQDFSNPTLLDPKTKEDRIKSFFYPDAFSTPDPFIINSNKIGYFYETDFEISASDFPDQSPETISKLEDLALAQIIDFYKKPKIWNFLVNDPNFLSVYYNDTSIQWVSPEQSGDFPLEVDQERIKNSSNFRAIDFKISLLEQRIKRLEDQLAPSTSNRHLDMELESERINQKIEAAKAEIVELEQEKNRFLSGQAIKKKDFWVVTTEEIKSQLPQNSTASWRSIEISTVEPLIKFVELRTPPLRPGMKYRALMEIDREKLDLIIYGDNPPTQESSELTSQVESDNESLVTVCPNQSKTQAKKSYSEMVAHAKKRRRELARTLKEVTSQRDTELTTPEIDLGIFGPYNFNKAFSGIHGLSGITNEYEYTKKALKLLGESGSAVLESLGITDTLAEDLEEAINEGTAKSESGNVDSKRFNQIKMPWSELKERIKTASDDLGEAAKVIQRDNITFIRGSNYKPDSEAELLRNIQSQLDEIVGNKKLSVKTAYPEERPTISALEDKYSDSEIIISISFSTLDYTGLGPKNGKKIKSINIFVQEKNWFDFETGIPNSIFSVSFDGQNETILKEYEALYRPRTVNYLSFIDSMTNPYPSSFKGFVKSFWDDGRSVCSELGISSDKGLAISLVGNYTSGIQVDLSRDEDGLIDAFKDWSKKNFVNPTNKWLQQSGQNAAASINDTFDEAAALKAFGKLCTLEQLYKEFTDKLDLKSLLCDYLKCLKLPAFDFKLPSFYLPPWPKVPIIGWYGYLVYFIVKQIKEILTRILCTFARTIIDKLAIPFCEEQLQDFISAGSSATPIMNQALAEALTDTGITSGNEQKAKDFFDDVANLTTGQELCRLLEGQPLDASTMQMLHRLAEKQGLRLDLDSDEAIINYFGVIGSFVPFDVCDKLAQLPNSDSLTAALPAGQDAYQRCEEILEMLAAIRNRLISGDSDVTDEEIDQVLDLAKKNFDDRKAQIEALSGANFDALLPPDFKPGTKEHQDTVVNSMPNFLSSVMQKSSENLFLGAKSSYISGLSTYVPSMKIRSPNMPTAFDSDYNYDTTLRLEAALEQVKNYTELLNDSDDYSGVSGSEISEALAESLGIFEDAAQNGMGDWSNSQLWADNPNYSFLDPNRDLDDPLIREENQSMIKELMKEHFLSTLKVKQIISAFTIFENFGHDPLAAVMKYNRELRVAPNVRIDVGTMHRDYLDESGQITRSLLDEFNLKDWWRVRPKGVANGATLEDAYSLIDRQISLTHDEHESWMRQGTENAIRNFTLVSHTLQDLDWYRSWIGSSHPKPLPSAVQAEMELFSIINSETPEHATKRKELIGKLDQALNSLNPFSDLEVFCETSHTDNSLSPNITVKRHSGRVSWGLRLMQIRNLSLQIKNPKVGVPNIREADNFGFDKKLDNFLSLITEKFYPSEGERQENLDSIYGNLTGENVFQSINDQISANQRTQFFVGPKGNPLFLVNDKKGRDFIPIVGFGNGIMTSLDDFVKSVEDSENKGYDIFLPIEKPEDFILVNPTTPHDRAKSFRYKVMKNNYPLFGQTPYSKRFDGMNPYATGQLPDGVPRLIAHMRMTGLGFNTGNEPADPAIDDYTDIYDGQSSNDAWNKFCNEAFTPFPGNEPTPLTNAHKRPFYGTSVLPINSADAIMNQTLKPNQHGGGQLQTFRNAIGHPFHQRLGFGFEDAQVKKETIPNDPGFYHDPHTWASDISLTHLNKDMYMVGAGYRGGGGKNSHLRSSAFNVAMYRMNDFNNGIIRIDETKRVFTVPKSEFSVLNSSNFIYRTKPNKPAEGSFRGGLGPEYSILNNKMWDPLGLRGAKRGERLDVFYKKTEFGRDTGIPGLVPLAEYKEDPSVFDWINPYVGRAAETQVIADEAHPGIGAAVFFMLPNRVLQSIPGHLTITGQLSTTLDALDGTGRAFGPAGLMQANGLTSYQEWCKLSFSEETRNRTVFDASTAFEDKGYEVRKSYLEFLEDRRYLMNEQLYMKIVKLLSNKKVVLSGVDGLEIPLVNNMLLKTFAMSILKNRIEILEKAMLVYGSYNERNLGEFSIFTGVEYQAPFEGFANAAGIEITPKEVKTLFTPFETEKIAITDGEGFNLVHCRFYKDQNNQEVKISYSDFINIIEDPLGTNWPTVFRNGQHEKVEFYLKPYKVGKPADNYFGKERRDLEIEVDDFDMSFETRTGDRIEINDTLPSVALGDDYKIDFISKDIFYLKDEVRNLEERDKKIVKDTFIRTSKLLLLDEDQDNLIELAQLEDGANVFSVKLAYTNSPSLLDIASERIERLTAMILEILQNNDQTFDYRLLPTISNIFSLIKKTHPIAGEQINLVYHGNGTVEDPKNIGVKFGILPYTPGVKTAEIPLSGPLNSDRFNIIVDSDSVLGLSFKPEMAKVSTNLDFSQQNLMLEDDTKTEKFRKIFSFCEQLPDHLCQQAPQNSTSQKEARREIFAKMVYENLESSGALKNRRGNQPFFNEEEEIVNCLKGEVFDEVVANLMASLTNCIQSSPLFEDIYADEVNNRVSGRPVITESNTGRCVSNRYSLDSSSILSFKKVIIGDVMKEVMAEMSKPENSPFNRDFGKPEPFDKAMKTISVKAFIRLCLVDLMLKGGLAYSVWDMESVISSPVFFEYVKEHVRRELDKNKLLRQIWGRTLENSQSITNKMAALDSVISEEIINFPQYSKQVFHPNTNKKDFYNWFAYGQTVFENEQDTEELVETDPFFTKLGAIPRVPSPSINNTGSTILLGKTHLGNAAKRLGKDDDMNKHGIFSHYRSYTKQRSDLSPTQYIQNTPTSKLIFEDYFKCRGKILEYYNKLHSPNQQDDDLTRHQILSYHDMERTLEMLKSESANVLEIEEVLNDSTISIGQRLCLLLYSPKIESAGPNFRNPSVESEFERSNISTIIERIHLDSSSEEKKKMINTNKAYAIRPISEIRFNSPGKITASIPLTSYDRDLSTEQCHQIMDLFDSNPLGPRNTEAIPSEFYLSISQSFAETDGFKDYLKHIFPVRRYMAMSTISATSVLGGFNDVPGLLEPAKNMVAFVAMVCSLPQEERQDLITMDQADWAKMMREKSPGDMNDADCFEFPGISGQFFIDFFKELLKIMYYFPSILFRGIANVLDPAYKEMRSHYMNCDIRHLNWRGVDYKSTQHLTKGGRNVLTNGLTKKGKYAPLIPAAPIDYGIGMSNLSYFNFKPLLQAVLKTVSYAYSGALPFLDLSAAFKVPCADIDENWKEGGKYDAGKYGRYGHPISPFTVLALSTLQLPADIEKRKDACFKAESEGEEGEQRIPDEECEEQFEE